MVFYQLHWWQETGKHKEMTWFHHIVRTSWIAQLLQHQKHEVVVWRQQLRHTLGTKFGKASTMIHSHISHRREDQPSSTSSYSIYESAHKVSNHEMIVMTFNSYQTTKVLTWQTTEPQGKSPLPKLVGSIRAAPLRARFIKPRNQHEILQWTEKVARNKFYGSDMQGKR